MAKATLIDQTRPDQTRPDQTRPDQTRPDQIALLVRNSSLELLRIIAMLMIITFHLSYKAGFDFYGEVLIINKLWMQFTGLGESLGYVSNDIFVIISGYFLIKSSRVKFIHLFRLWSHAAFYVIMFLLVGLYFGADKADFSTLLKTLQRLITMHWWFITCYAALYLVHPFLNSILHNLTQANYKRLILLMLGTWSIVLLFTADIKLLPHKIVDFFIMYAAGGYIRLWADGKGNRKYILWSIMFMLINFACLSVFRYKFNMTRLAGIGIYPVKYMCAMSGIFNFASAMCMFIGFKKLVIPSSKIINTLAAAVTGVYMLHDHVHAIKFMRYVFRLSSFQNSPYLIPRMISDVLIVYISCTVLELIRSRIFKMLSRGRLS